MKPFYFGSSKKPLLGVYHAPGEGVTPTGGGVILCYPMGAEYMRAHSVFRTLAMLLARQGLHVLRFDYYGTGDSAGRGDQGSVGQWLDDIGMAIDELRATTGVARPSLAGLRFGGTLAGMAATRRTDLDRVVLWNPVVHGGGYIRQIVARAQEVSVVGAAQGESSVPTHSPGLSGTLGIEGFPLTEEMRNAISDIDLADCPRFLAGHLSLLVSHEEPHYTRLRDRWKALRLSHSYRVLPHESPRVSAAATTGDLAALLHDFVGEDAGCPI